MWKEPMVSTRCKVMFNLEEEIGALVKWLVSVQIVKIYQV